MAAKKAAITQSDNGADADIIQNAYAEGLKNLFSVYFNGCIDNHQAAEERFVKGLKILRDARNRARELVK
jgi:hypothetical protein